jgi:hypothetical protein
MSERRNFKFVVTCGIVFSAGIILSLAGVILAQTAANKTLVVNGTSAGAAVREIDGHTYIEIEALARVTNGVVTIEPTRVLLSIPAASLAAVTTAAVPQAARPAAGLSVEFKRAAISELSEMREWRGAVGAMITYGLAAGSATAQDYHAICEAGLSQATVVATTNEDLNAVQLLKGEFDTLSAWAAQVVADRKALNGARTIDPNSMANDPVLAKITSCGRFLNTMIVSGAYADDVSCH